MDLYRNRESNSFKCVCFSFVSRCSANIRLLFCAVLVAYSQLKRQLKFDDIFESLPVSVRNPHLITGLLYELDSRDQTSNESDRLDLSTNPFLEKHLEFLIESVDDFMVEQAKMQTYHRQVQRQSQAQQQYLAKKVCPSFCPPVLATLCLWCRSARCVHIMFLILNVFSLRCLHSLFCVYSVRCLHEHRRQSDETRTSPKRTCHRTRCSRPFLRYTSHLCCIVCYVLYVYPFCVSVCPLSCVCMCICLYVYVCVCVCVYVYVCIVLRNDDTKLLRSAVRFDASTHIMNSSFPTATLFSCLVLSCPMLLFVLSAIGHVVPILTLPPSSLQSCACIRFIV